MQGERERKRERATRYKNGIRSFVAAAGGMTRMIELERERERVTASEKLKQMAF